MFGGSLVATVYFLYVHRGYIIHHDIGQCTCLEYRLPGPTAYGIALSLSRLNVWTTTPRLFYQVWLLLGIFFDGWLKMVLNSEEYSSYVNSDHFIVQCCMHTACLTFSVTTILLSFNFWTLFLHALYVLYNFDMFNPNS